MLGSVAVLVGVLLNIGLNLILLPRYGLTGAVAATAVANFAALATTYLLAMRCGLKFDVGVWIVLALPPVFCAGPWITLLALTIIAAWACLGRGILTAQEKHQLLNSGRMHWERARSAALAIKYLCVRSAG
jgi:O-antigen/teichoic acid export membrane protein